MTEFEIVKELDDYLSKQQLKSSERDYFYVSEIGKSKKAIYESIKNPQSQKIEARLRRIFDNGNYMHSRYYKYFAEMGILIAAEVDAVKNDLLHGRADAIISNKKDLYVIDLKSCSQWTFNKLKEPDYSHMIQLMVYMYFLNIPKGFILYENKDNQTIKIFYITLDKNKVEAVIEDLRKLKDMIINNIIPDEENVTMEDIQY